MNAALDIDTIDWSKGAGLLPAIVQDAVGGRVLMLGYMNREALALTLSSHRVTFYSRSREALWTKGESSGNGLELVDVAIDCDRDTLLVLARQQGPTCHRQTDTCFDPAPEPLVAELGRLDALIAQRVRDRPEGSYTTRLIEQGALRVAQKVGEEGVETALAGAAQSTEQLIGEAADLVYHLGVLMHVRGSSLADVLRRLRERRRDP